MSRLDEAQGLHQYKHILYMGVFNAGCWFF